MIVRNNCIGLSISLSGVISHFTSILIDKYVHMCL